MPGRLSQYPVKPVVDYILSHQQADGGFHTYERYPVLKPDEDWSVLPAPSGFVAASVLFSLMQLKDEALKNYIERGCKFLIAQSELQGFWRFWSIRSGQHPLPFDIDVTAVCSYVLEQNSYPQNNKTFLYGNADSTGYYFTWVIPTLKNFITQPVLSLRFLSSCARALPTWLVKFYAYTDKEPGVAANALLYLGENENTTACIEVLIKEIRKDNFPLQFYQDELIVYYHVARAHSCGVKKLGALKEVICTRIKKTFETGFEQKDELLRLMGAIALLDFKGDRSLAEALIDSVRKSDMYPDKWKCFAYFSSKDRNFLAGSPVYTAAIFIEAVSKLQAP
jgi:hypothetical protein